MGENEGVRMDPVFYRANRSQFISEMAYLQVQLWGKMRVLGWIMSSIGPTGLNLFIEK